MTTTQLGILRAAITTYGEQNQLTVAIEELSELIKEISKVKRERGDLDHLSEEMADVYIMLEQLKILFSNGHKVDRYITRKINRLNMRLYEDICKKGEHYEP